MTCGGSEMEFGAFETGRQETQPPRAPAQLNEMPWFNNCVQELPPQDASRVAETALCPRAAEGFSAEFRSGAARPRIRTQAACYSRGARLRQIARYPAEAC
jgi:hypothetical protein